MESTLKTKYVSISEFSRGNTARIFKDLSSYHEIIVLKNNKPVGILYPPKNN